MNIKTIKFICNVATVIGGLATVVGSLAGAKVQEAQIAEKVAEANAKIQG